jgi:hypothetical protein
MGARVDTAAGVRAHRQAGEHEQGGDDVTVQEDRGHPDASPGRFTDAKNDAQGQQSRQARAPSARTALVTSA